MTTAHIPTQADFDLGRVMDLFDTALTSKDERVINALRSLLMIVALTAPESDDEVYGQNLGPFRQLHEEVRNLYRRIDHLEQQIAVGATRPQPYTGTTPYNPYPGAGSPFPGTAGGPYWGIPPSTTTWSGPGGIVPPTSSASVSLSSSDVDAIINKTTTKITK